MITSIDTTSVTVSQGQLFETAIRLQSVDEKFLAEAYARAIVAMTEELDGDRSAETFYVLLGLILNEMETRKLAKRGLGYSPVEGGIQIFAL